MGTNRTAGLVRATATSAVLAVALVLPSCLSNGHINILGYTSEPNYDLRVRTIHVPIFQNETQRDSTRQGMEFDLTQAVIREIQMKTPYLVRNDGSPADSELTGKIVQYNKMLLNRNQLNEVREAEMTLGVEVTWKDLRSGEILSQTVVPLPYPQVLEDTPQPPAKPVLVQSVGDFIPELGESITTARQKNINRLAVQIVSMMEKPWELPCPQ
jgi:Lipopolysaccharide-assembly